MIIPSVFDIFSVLTSESPEIIIAYSNYSLIVMYHHICHYLLLYPKHFR